MNNAKQALQAGVQEGDEPPPPDDDEPWPGPIANELLFWRCPA